MGMFEILDERDIAPYPPGANKTDTVFGGIHFNTTVFDHWNYTLYSNGTISNNSKCYLTFEPYEPQRLLNNGTFINATTCYSAIDPIGTRGYTGIGFAVAFGVGLVLTITALAKHGPLYLPKETRFAPIGRRWQWYWACFACAAALISLFTNVDVDRYYLQELPIILTTFFFYLMCMGVMAQTWEAVRHWGVWQERQFIDPNPHVYGIDDARAKTEFWVPLWFYFWVWMNFFMVVPRSWNFVKMQHSPEQSAAIAEPGSQGVRFKVGGFCLVIAWLTILFSLRHSIRFYKPRNRGIYNRVKGFIQAIPFRFALLIPLSGALIAYQILITFIWDFSLMKYDGNVAIIYGWGYGPALAILYIQLIYGYFSPNEDKELLRQRRERGELLDRELGLVKRPAWWRRVKGDHLHNLRDKIGLNVKEIGGGHATGRRVEDAMERFAREEALRAARDDDNVELSYMGSKQKPSYGSPANDPHNPRLDRAGARGISFASPSAAVFDEEDETVPPPYSDRARNGAASRTNSTSTTGSLSAPPQKIRSMLDV